jgi:hypothetical protein
LDMSNKAKEKIRNGTASAFDEAVATACQIEPSPIEPVETQTDRIDKTGTVITTQNAAAPTARCGIKLSGNGRWGWNNGRFCPFPLTELALLARHGVFPWICR